MPLIRVLITVLFLAVFSSANALENPLDKDKDLISIDLVDAPLSDTIQLAIKGLIGKNYIIHPDLTGADKKLTIQLKDVKKSKALNIIENLLNEQGIGINIQDDVIYVMPLRIKSKELVDGLPKVAAQSVLNDIFNINPSENIASVVGDLVDFRIYKVKHKRPAELQAVLSMFGIQSNSPTNQILLYKAKSEQDVSILELFEKLDVPNNQYEVIAATYEVSKRDDSQRSMDVIGEVFKNVGISILTSGASNVIKFAGQSLSMAFKFFDTDTRFRSIVKPYGVVNSGEKLRYQSGQDVPVLGNITTNNNSTQQAIEYRQSGVILDVDLYAGQDAIDLKINHELSNFIQTRIGVNSTPTLNKQSINTTVSVNDGEILVLGGMTDKTGTFTNSSALGLVPVERTKTSQDKETYIFLQVNKI